VFGDLVVAAVGEQSDLGGRAVEAAPRRASARGAADHLLGVVRGAPAVADDRWMAVRLFRREVRGV
jgi:hypothetical protein